MSRKPTAAPEAEIAAPALTVLPSEGGSYVLVDGLLVAEADYLSAANPAPEPTPETLSETGA